MICAFLRAPAAAMTDQHLLHFGDALSRGQLINWEYLGFLFKQISPYFFACLGISLAVGLSIAGAAWCAFASLSVLSTRSKQCCETPFRQGMFVFSPKTPFHTVPAQDGVHTRAWCRQ